MKSVNGEGPILQFDLFSFTHRAPPSSVTAPEVVRLPSDVVPLAAEPLIEDTSRPNRAGIGVTRTAVTIDRLEACRSGSNTDDAGEILLGSRKDRHRQAFALADLDGLTGAQKVEQVVKDAVWPVPDYAALAESGCPVRALALVKIVRDSLAARPKLLRLKTFDECVVHYITILSELRESLATPASVEAVAAAARAVHDRHTQKGLGTVCIRSTSPLRLSAYDTAKADRLIANGFPEAVEAWRRGHSLRRWAEGGATVYAVYRGRQWIGGLHPSEAAAWDWLKAHAATRKRTRREETGLIPEFPHLAVLERIGPTCPTGVRSDDFVTTFGFRGVQFGIWLADKERQVVLDHAYAGLLDLAEIVGIPPETLALAGRREAAQRKALGIAFGARGRGGRAVAHYEPGEVVVNMTKFTGAGRVAHEFWHAIDHWLGLLGHVEETEAGWARMGSGGHSHDRDRRRALPDLASDLVDALIALIRACTKMTPTLDEARRSVERQQSHLAASLESAQRRLDALTGRARTAKHVRDLESDIHSTRLALDLIEAQATEIELGRMPDALVASRPSQYLRHARALDPKTKPYWSTPCELTARAFEAWVFDQLLRRERKSEYLVHSADEGRFAPPLYKADIFPSGTERSDINAAFDRLMPLIARTIIARHGR